MTHLIVLHLTLAIGIQCTKTNVNHCCFIFLLRHFKLLFSFGFVVDDDDGFFFSNAFSQLLTCKLQEIATWKIESFSPIMLRHLPLDFGTPGRYVCLYGKCTSLNRAVDEMKNYTKAICCMHRVNIVFVKPYRSSAQEKPLHLSCFAIILRGIKKQFNFSYSYSCFFLLIFL